MYALPDRRRRAVRPSPIFLAIIAVTALGGVLAWTGSPLDRSTRIGVFILVLGAWVVSLCLHEFAHAYAAYRAGDTSVEAAGYLTLNPLKYTHPVLSILLPLFFIAQGGIGFPGGAVYLHPHTFRTRAARSIASAVGPASNLVFGAIILLIVRLHGDGSTEIGGILYTGGDHFTFWSALSFLGFLQFSAAVLNLLPIPGLDGYGIIEPYLAPETTQPLERVKPFGMIGVYILLQQRQINAWFFDIVRWLYERTGANYDLSSWGYTLFRFWRQI
jgi:Zn-dependent protease